MPPTVDGTPQLALRLMPNLRLRGARFYAPALRAASYWILAPWRVRQAVAFARAHRVDLVWGWLQNEAVLLAKKIAHTLGVPLVGSVCDDPDGWLRDGGYDRLSRWLLRRRFRQALTSAVRLSTAGEVMQETYAREYGVRSVILRHGFEGSRTPPIVVDRADRRTLVGFVGSVYGNDAWTAFLRACAEVNASGTLPPVTIRAFSNNFHHHHPGVTIEARGWQPPDVMLPQLAETDFCYLPYWFDSVKRRHVELSFPNKLETYLAVGRPVLFHGPAYAGVATVIRQYGVGMCLHSLDHRAVMACLEKLISDKVIRESFSRASIAAFRSEFNADSMVRTLATLIGVDPAVLAADPPPADVIVTDSQE